MDIGSVIKKYRKIIGLTQEEVANRLGVSTPAVNKWENGNSNPDIELLPPIARLLNISLDTLLSFNQKLTDVEIEEIIKQMDKMFSKEGYDKTYEWAVKVINKYPNCNMLIWQAAVILDARRLTGGCEDPNKYDDQINLWYERALTDEDETIRHHAADSLFSFYLRKKDYTMAEKYLGYFSDYDPMKKVYWGRLNKEQGKTEDAYKMFEAVLFSGYNILNFAFSFMSTLALEEGDTAYARFLAEKMGILAHVFEMGKYNEYAFMLNIVCAEKNIEGTYKIVKQMLENVDSMTDFQKSKLYRHMKFRNVNDSYFQEIREKLIKSFRNEDDFDFMKGYEPWENFICKQ